MSNKFVAVIMGSLSDKNILSECIKQLDILEVPYEWKVYSAHRTPEDLNDYIEKAKNRGLTVIIAAAGAAAHLAGNIAGKTVLPVIGIPLNASDLNGLDALLSTVQMPKGIPVAAMAVGKAGAINAAIFAAQILALSEQKFTESLLKQRENDRKKILDSSL